MTEPACRVMVFARAPEAGRVKTRLIPALGAAGAAALHRRLVRHSVRAALAAAVGPVELWCTPRTGDPLFAECSRDGVSLHLQGEGDLGERMQRAFEDVLARSARALIIGSDLPALSPAYLRDAAAALERNDAVLGPAEDGGYVLLGLRRCDPEIFRGIAWGGAQVLAQTRGRLAALHWRWQELPTLWDLDRPEDLRRLKRLEQYR